MDPQIEKLREQQKTSASVWGTADKIPRFLK